MTGPDVADSAAALLLHAYNRRDRVADDATQPCVGLFGNGLPETLIAAQGALPVHLPNAAVDAGDHPISAVIEPFVDHEVRTFLIRLMQGAFGRFKAIIFARDDAPAMIAYQYATEWLRQNRPHGAVPPLFLWNLVHTDSAPVARFNKVQADKLERFLVACGLPPRDEAALAMAANDEAARRDALAGMSAQRGEKLTGKTAHIWRNAGRYLAAAHHAALLNDAIPVDTVNHTRRIAVVGSPLADMATYEMIEGFGAIVADLQPFGDDWPAAANREAELSTLLAMAAIDPACPRTTPADTQFRHLCAQIDAAGCDLVIAQLAQTDDTFGWEIPRLFKSLRDKGVICVNLGFRDPAPDAAWLNASADLIARALEDAQ